MVMIESFCFCRRDIGRAPGKPEESGNDPSPAGWEQTVRSTDCRRFCAPVIGSDHPGSYTFKSGPLGALAIYFGPHPERISVVSSDPALTAALCQSDMDWTAHLEDLLFGYRFGRRTPYQKVQRLLPNESLEIRHDGTATISALQDTGEPATSGTLIDLVGEMVCGDDAFELTGGVDSRLVLALALAAGVPPEKAFTIGNEESTDVLIARDLCRRFGIEHRTIKPTLEADRLVDDASRFVRESGYAANSASYGWLPSVYRSLASMRNAQVTGTGGECAGGFFDSGMDAIVDMTGLESKWLRRRLEVPGNLGSAMFSTPLAIEVEREVQSDISAAVSGSEPLRCRFDRVYIEQRIRQWAAPVLRASSAWYTVKAPLMSSEYVAWARGLPLERRGRAAQRDLIDCLAPQMRDIPFASDVARKSRLARLGNKTAKYARRALGLRRPGDLAADETALSLSRLSVVQEAISRLVEEHPGVFRRNTVNQLMRDPARYSHELGFLLTMAWAYQAAAEGQSVHPKTSQADSTC